MQNKEMNGTLFLNNRKTKENHPDYTGGALVNGQSLRISMWRRTAANGNEYWSLAFAPEQEGGYQQAPASAPAPQQQRPAQQRPQRQAPAPQKPAQSDDDDFPF